MVDLQSYSQITLQILPFVRFITLAIFFIIQRFLFYFELQLINVFLSIFKILG